MIVFMIFFSAFFICVLLLLFGWVHFFFQVVHAEPIIARLLRAHAAGVTLVLIPTHRSHLDYLLLSYICFVYGLPMPHIAAGENLNLPGVGAFLQRSGAFFIRRSFRSDGLYKAIVGQYTQALVTHGHCLEFFIEGTSVICSPQMLLLLFLVMVRPYRLFLLLCL
jgi:glycerol-3-phosphate O-acyltransferase